MRELGRGRLLEAGDARALRVERGEHMLDRAVLAAGVERLQDDEDRVLVLGVEQGLLLEELLLIGLDLLLRLVLRLVLALVGGIEFASV